MKRIEEESSRQKKSRRSPAVVLPLLAGACALCVCITILAIQLNKGTDSPAPAITRHVTVPGSDSIAETIRLPRWEERGDYHRYCSITYRGAEYRSMLIAVHEDHQGGDLGSGIAFGQDYYTDEIRETPVQLSEITGISPSVAVSVRFDNGDTYPYAYVNGNYLPATLGDLIRDLNLTAELTTGNCYRYVGADTYSYEDVSTQTVWEQLLSDESLVNQPEPADPGEKLLDIDVSVDVLGYHHRAMWITSNGYLCTNLCETGKYFYIGPEKAQAFFRDVTENHQAYLLIYDLIPDGDAVEE